MSAFSTTLPGSRSSLSARTLRVEYASHRGRDAVVALEDFSTDVRPGEFVSLVGPSGCGKTTFLMVAAGLVPPNSGSVEVDGRPVNGPGPDRAVVFQDASLLPWYTASQNAAYGLICQGIPRRVAIDTVAPLIDMVGLRGFERHYPHELSGGMQQRVNLARALAVEPRILLMDEPFAALDAQTREIMQDELLKIWETSHKTVLFITHQISEALFLSDRVIVMSARPGRVLADINIDLVRPRELAVKRLAQFVHYEEEIWRLLEQEVRREMATGLAAPTERG